MGGGMSPGGCGASLVGGWLPWGLLGGLWG